MVHEARKIKTHIAKKVDHRENKCAEESRDEIARAGTAVQIHKSLKWGEAHPSSS